MACFAITLILFTIPSKVLKTATNSMIHTSSVEIPQDFLKRSQLINSLSSLEIHVNLKPHCNTDGSDQNPLSLHWEFVPDCIPSVEVLQEQ